MSGGNYFRGTSYNEGAIFREAINLECNYPRGQLPGAQFSSGEIILGGDCPGGNHPGVNYPCGNYPGAIVLGGNCPRVQSSGTIVLELSSGAIFLEFFFKASNCKAGSY